MDRVTSRGNQSPPHLMNHIRDERAEPMMDKLGNGSLDVFEFTGDSKVCSVNPRNVGGSCESPLSFHFYVRIPLSLPHKDKGMADRRVLQLARERSFWPCRMKVACAIAAAQIVLLTSLAPRPLVIGTASFAQRRPKVGMKFAESTGAQFSPSSAVFTSFHESC